MSTTNQHDGSLTEDVSAYINAAIEAVEDEPWAIVDTQGDVVETFPTENAARERLASHDDSHSVENVGTLKQAARDFLGEHARRNGII